MPEIKIDNKEFPTMNANIFDMEEKLDKCRTKIGDMTDDINILTTRVELLSAHIKMLETENKAQWVAVIALLIMSLVLALL